MSSLFHWEIRCKGCFW